jgi:hypothetical protein
MICLVATAAMAQMPMQSGFTSPAATASVAFGGKQIRINYHAPSMHGREIFGGLVPYGQVWRAGANEATLLHTELDLIVGGLVVPRGDYSLYILPEENKWTVIINKQTGQWGIGPKGTTEDPAQDLGRVIVRPAKLPAPVETWTIALTQAGNQGNIVFSWANLVATVPYRVK